MEKEVTEKIVQSKCSISVKWQAHESVEFALNKRVPSWHPLPDLLITQKKQKQFVMSHLLEKYFLIASNKF